MPETSSVHAAPQSIPTQQAQPSHPSPASFTSQQSVDSSMEEEDYEEYKPGGYHPVKIGDKFSDGRYTIVRKLGWGHFSTVWLARDDKEKRHVALKVVKSDGHYTETALDEIQLLQRLVTSNPNHPGRRHVVQLLDDFRHTGPHGVHVCMVFEVLGESLLGLIKRYQHRGVPPHIVQQIAKQVLLGLDYLHTECKIIHTDLKPENVLICIEDVEAVVEAELATCPAAVPTKLVGVPPSQGRGGTQTPRRESMFVVGSQPLPSPSSSYGSSPMMDKFAFGMTSIANGGAQQSSSMLNPATSAAKAASSTDRIKDALGGVKIGGDSMFEKTKVAPALKKVGASLLSQQAPTKSNLSQSSPSPNNGTSTASPSSSTTTGPMGPTPSTSMEPTTPPAGSVSTSVMSTTSDSPGSEGGVPQSGASSMAVSHGAGARQLATGNHYPVAPEAGDPTTLPPPFPYDPASLERITVKIADLGNACWVEHHFTNDIQTRQYRCPEIIIGNKWGPSVDNWSAACLIFELITGDYLFDPQPGAKYDKDDDHIAQIAELIGDIPKSLALGGRYSSDLFNKRGELKHIHKLRYWPLKSVLREKYGMTDDESELFSSFLIPLLNLQGDKRAAAKAMLDHTWLGNIIVQGEIEALERGMQTGGLVLNESNLQAKRHGPAVLA